ncbi:MAG: hypothetical protein IKP54_08325 [Bacteroidales bacterium]|nr:hypothetical protein [Bacteroidales bacterium]
MKNVLVDSCFWFAYLSTRCEELTPKAKEIYEYIEKMQCNIIIPYPSLYETVNTKLLKDKNKNTANWFLMKLTADPKFKKVFDDKYRENALAATSANHKRKISLVDNIIRLMMEDKTLHIDALITFNSSDFEDVCRNVGIELINENTVF